MDDAPRSTARLSLLAKEPVVAARTLEIVD
jgi:hypothetical protein